MNLLYSFFGWLERAVLAAFDEPHSLRWEDNTEPPPATPYPISHVTVVEPWLAELEAVGSDEELRRFISHPRPLLTGTDAVSLLDADLRRGLL